MVMVIIFLLMIIMTTMMMMVDSQMSREAHLFDHTYEYDPQDGDNLVDDCHDDPDNLLADDHDDDDDGGLPTVKGGTPL